MIFSNPSFIGHEQVHFWNDEKAGLKAIAAIHRAQPNNAIGGCRMFAYSSEADALNDVLRLSRAMSYKCALAGIEMGGGKCVIIGDPTKHKTEALLRSMGRFIQSLNGQFYTGEDVGIGVDDVAVMRKETQYLVGRPGADSSSVAAYGAYEGVRSTLEYVFASPDPRGKHIAIQGLGQVGYRLAQYLAEAGAQLTVSDINTEAVDRAVRELGAKAVSLDKIVLTSCDVFAPCAMGGVITEDIAQQLHCKIIAGAANNQLTTPSVGMTLKVRGIVYAPDYVINAGGVINNALTLSPDFSSERVMKDAARIGQTLLQVYALAEKENISNDAAASKIGDQRMASYALCGHSS